MEKDLISIIIPVYNTEKYIRRCLDSILAQTYKNYELLLIDDGSEDASGCICDEYALKDDRIKVIHQENEGSATARNRGLEIAKGEFIGFIDSDDYVETDFYETLHELISETQADVSMVSYNFVKDGVYAQKTTSGTKNVVTRKKAVMQLLYDDVFQNFVWNKLYRTRLFTDIRFPYGVIYDDINIMYKIFKKMNKIAYLDVPKYYYFFNDNGMTNTKNHKKFVDETTAIITRFHEVNKDFPSLSETNSYSLCLWMTRIYKYMILEEDSNDMFFKQHISLLREVCEKHMEFIMQRLNSEKRMLLLLLLWDVDRGRTIVKSI